MKKLLLTTMLFFCLCADLLSGIFFAPFFSSQRANAESSAATQPVAGDYACVLREDVFFYAAPNENEGLFLLPATYYVKLLDYSPQFSRVEYLYDDAQTKKLVGYVKTENLTFVDYQPKRPYFYYVFDLSYRIDETLLENSDFLNEITVSCCYYGDYKIGSKTYCYVLRGESFGYVPKPAALTVSENTEYADYLAQQTSSDSLSLTQTEKESSPAQIAILVALCLLVPVLAALILKPPRRPPYETDGE